MTEQEHLAELNERIFGDRGQWFAASRETLDDAYRLMIDNAVEPSEAKDTICAIWEACQKEYRWRHVQGSLRRDNVKVLQSPAEPEVARCPNMSCVLEGDHSGVCKTLVADTEAKAQPTGEEAYEAGYGHGYGNGHYDATSGEPFDSAIQDSFEIWIDERSTHEEETS